MKTLYLDCSMGAAGDMLMAALLELHPHREDFLRRLNGLGLPGVQVAAEPSVKCGVRGTHMAVSVHGQEEGCHDHCDHSHSHGHAAVGDILRLLSGLPLPEKVREDAAEVYRLIAQAESQVHGQPVDQVHFHEVGALDAVADVVGVSMLMAELGAEEVTASPVHVGSGQVRCAHGLLPVPAPATALLLQGIPIYGGEIRGELCTPTGAALLRRFVSAFGPLPPMTVEAVGYGMGARDFPAANCLRAMLGRRTEEERDEAAELCCNLDDMTGEDVAFAAERLLAAGALDVWTRAITMKKGRPGVELCCLCRRADRERLTGEMLRHTTTLGVRSRLWQRTVLPRRMEERPSPWGPVVWKVSGGRAKPEYEQLADIARREDIPLARLRRALERGD